MNNEEKLIDNLSDANTIIALLRNNIESISKRLAPGTSEETILNNVYYMNFNNEFDTIFESLSLIQNKLDGCL